MRRVKTSWNVIEGVLRQNANSAFTALRGPATENRIDRLQRHFTAPLPQDFLQSLKIHDGMRVKWVFFNCMTLLPAVDVIKWSQVQRDVQSMGEFPGDDTDPSPAIKNEWRWRDNWVPVMADAGGNLVVMDLDPAEGGKRGQVFRWRNADPHCKVVANSFAAWLDIIAEELSRRRFTICEFGDIQTDQQIA